MQKHKRYLAQYICPPRPNWYQRTWMVYPDTKDGITVTVKWLIFVSQFRCSNNSLTLKHETTLCSDGRAISAIETGKWTSHPSCLDPPAETKRRHHSWYNSCWCCSKEKRRSKSTPQSVMFIVVENWHWNPTSPTLCIVCLIGLWMFLKKSHHLCQFATTGSSGRVKLNYYGFIYPQCFLYSQFKSVRLR